MPEMMRIQPERGFNADIFAENTCCTLNHADKNLFYYIEIEVLL